MEKQKVFTLINHQNGNLAFKLFSFEDNVHFDHLQRNEFYTIIWLKAGNGLLKVDFCDYKIEENTLFAFSPFQPFMFSTEDKIKGIAIQFHSDFYCIHRKPSETNCDNVLFNNIYQEPFFKVDKNLRTKFDFLIEELKYEFSTNDNQNYELLIPNLKVFLGNASREKLKSVNQKPKFSESKTPYILQTLKDEIEKNFKEKHSASDYAELLHISPNALAKVVKSHYNQTLTELITGRIIVEAKRELYMTSKPMKQIAWALGYQDEYYFSRLFKNNTGVSPQMYRDTVGFGKAEMN